jgi:hypothetical protein
MKIFAALFCISLIQASCLSHQESDKLLNPQKMTAVLSDYLKSEIYIHDFLTADSALRDSFEMAVAQERIFSKHGVSKEQFVRSFEYYSEHGAEFLPIIDSLLVRTGQDRIYRGKEREGLRLLKQQK